MGNRDEDRHGKWACFKLSVVGRLLAAPPPKGELRTQLAALAQQTWVHPIRGEPVCFGLSTIERWYYRALAAGPDPLRALRRKVRSDAGTHPSLGEELRKALEVQYRSHRRWSVKLHYDNLRSQARQKPELGQVPSYSVVRRHMQDQGMRRAKGRRTPHTEGAEAAARRFESREVRGYEAEYVGALYHADFHECSRAVLAPDGTWRRPQLYSCLDDRSRLALHLQWYWSECAETCAHGTQQVFMKRGLCREFMSDRGPAEMAEEITKGLERAGGIEHKPTLPYSPYQNAKQEVFWAQVEGRLMAMLEGVDPLTLDYLNQATQAWAELDYNREVHSELGATPLERWLEGPTVVRDSPGPEALRDAFRRTESRAQRHSDGTVSIRKRRFEIPSRYAHLRRVSVRYAKWDLTNVHLVDARSDTVLCRLFPQDKAKNAGGQRAARQGPATSERGTPLAPLPASGVAPLLAEYMAEYAARGLPAAYLPLDDFSRLEADSDEQDEDDEGEAGEEEVVA